MATNAEIRAALERGQPFHRPGGVDPATIFLAAADVRSLLDELDGDPRQLTRVRAYATRWGDSGLRQLLDQEDQ